MAREWQQTRHREFVLPDAVYYQSLWAVRDLERLENRLAQLKEEEQNRNCGTSVVAESMGGILAVPTENHAIEKAVLQERIDAIISALTVIPESYRLPILKNIILKEPVTELPAKLWRIWKQRFLYYVAKNLSLL